jgi:hypothetical protein
MTHPPRFRIGSGCPFPEEGERGWMRSCWLTRAVSCAPCLDCFRTGRPVAAGDLAAKRGPEGGEAPRGGADDLSPPLQRFTHPLPATCLIVCCPH